MASLVIVPGDGVAWSQCKNPCQDIAAFQYRLDVFDFVGIGLWLQFAALVIVAAVLITLAAAYIW